MSDIEKRPSSEVENQKDCSMDIDKVKKIFSEIDTTKDPQNIDDAKDILSSLDSVSSFIKPDLSKDIASSINTASSLLNLLGGISDANGEIDKTQVLNIAQSLLNIIPEEEIIKNTGKTIEEVKETLNNKKEEI